MSTTQLNTAVPKVIDEVQKNRTQIKGNKSKSIANATDIATNKADLNNIKALQMSVYGTAAGASPDTAAKRDITVGQALSGTVGSYNTTIITKSALDQELKSFGSSSTISNLQTNKANITLDNVDSATVISKLTGDEFKAAIEKAGFVLGSAMGTLQGVGLDTPPSGTHTNGDWYLGTHGDVHVWFNNKWNESSVDFAAYLTKTEAGTTYLAKTDAVNTYETKVHAAATYQPIGNYLTSHQSLANYLTTASAASTYVTQTSYSIDDSKLNALIGDGF